MLELEIAVLAGIKNWIKIEVPKPGFVDGPW